MAAPAEAAKPLGEVEVTVVVGKEANTLDKEEMSPASVPAKKPALEHCVVMEEAAPSNEKKAEGEAVDIPVDAAPSRV